MNLNHEQRLQPLERADAQARKDQPVIVAPLSCSELIRLLADACADAVPLVRDAESVIANYPGADEVLAPFRQSVIDAVRGVRAGIAAAKAAAEQLQPVGSK